MVSHNEHFLQLADDEHTVVMVRHNCPDLFEWVSPQAVRAAMGITPAAVPTFLALTRAPKAKGLADRQAVRLIEVYGDLDSIYKDLPNLPSAHVRRRLQENETQVRDYLAKNTADQSTQVRPHRVSEWSLNDIDTASNRQLLRSYGFHSLAALLGNPSQGRPDVNERTPRAQSYHAVVDSNGLKQLEALLLSSKLCAIDTESDDKDPRKGDLLGVAFSVVAGEAYYIPAIESDLRGLRKDDVLRFLKRVCESEISFIGHNIKYDYLLLRRHGVRINCIHFDTMLAAYDCHGDWDFFNLPYLSQTLLNEKIKSCSDLVDQNNTLLDVPFKELVDHACGDADITMRLYPILLAELDRRSITGQFYDQTMCLMRCLGELEFQGVPADLAKLDAIHRDLRVKASDLKDELCGRTGKAFDLDSEKDLWAVLREALALRGYFASRRITMPMLEQIASSEPIAQLVVRYKRLRSRISELQTMCTCITNGRIYPLFNQIKSRAGLLTSGAPSLFDSGVSPHLKSCFDACVRDYFTDAERSLDILLHLTQDPVLQEVRTRPCKGEVFMAEHAIMKGLDEDELLLSLAAARSDATRRLAERFSLIEPQSPKSGTM